MLHCIRKAAVAFLMCCVCVTAISRPAAAAVKEPETRTPITSVSIRVTSDVKGEYDYNAATVYATTDSNLYTIGSYTWKSSSGKEYWEPGDIPKVQIEIHARSGYFFDKTTGANKFQISGAKYTSVKRQNENETLLLTVELTPASGTLEISNSVEWVGYPLGKAVWEAVPYAGAYELKLYRDEQQIYGVPKVNTITYDFYPLMTKGGRYYYKVRAIPKNTEEEAYLTSGDWVSSDELELVDGDAFGADKEPGPNTNITPAEIGWVKNDDGWWYRNTDGTYPTNTWQVIDGSWYLFGYDGYILTGWQLKNGRYYYLDTNGALQTGWFQDNRKWYYLEADGAMHTGWLDLNGTRYYMEPDGIMHKGWLLEGGKWYYMNQEDGSITRNTSIGGYFLDANGVWQN